MLVEFRVKNYRSFADEAFIQLDAVKAFSEHPDNLIETENGRFLKTLAIYGANASGKSNLIAAMNAFRRLVMRSGKYNSTDKISYHPFLLDDNLAIKPTLFEIRISLDGLYYRYGCEVTRECVVSEWLLWSKKLEGRDWPLFTRDAAGVAYGNSYRGERVQEKELLRNTLLLSRLDQKNVEIAVKILGWISRIGILQGLNDQGVEDFTAKRLEIEGAKRGILALTRLADQGIDDLQMQPVPDEKIPPPILKFITEKKIERPNDIYFLRKKVDGSGEVGLSLDRDESAGTAKMFRFAGVWMDILTEGSVAFVDELEAKLHPLLTRRLIMMFNSAEVNKRGAQLIFVTHDTNLLAYGGLRRDQVWFCEKDQQGRSSLYSLAEIKDSSAKRKNALFEKNYIEGKYGAIPFFGGMDALAALFDDAVTGEGANNGARN